MNKTISILVDNDSWILPFASLLGKKINEFGYEVVLARHHDEICTGWINFILGCIHIIPKNILTKNRHNLVVHESLLPHGKGFAPMSWQILEGKNEIPICLIEATEELDAGDIWLVDSIHLDGTELNAEWREKQGLKSIAMCLSFIRNYADLKPTPQSGVASYYRRRRPQDSELDVNKSIRQQFNLLRITDNQSYPAFFYLDGVKYKLEIDKA